MAAILDVGDAIVAPPFRGECPKCADVFDEPVEVLVVEVAGVDVVVELAEILEIFPCPQCAQVEAKGHTRGVCWRCENTGIVGVELPPFGVAVDADGTARYFTGSRGEGEAVYVEHVCRRR